MWHELCVLVHRLPGRCIHWAIKIHNTEISRIIVYKHYVTDDVINGKLVTGYYESLKEF